MWDKFNSTHPSNLAGYLKNEYPQTVAVILTNLSSKQSGAVVELLPENFAVEVVIRMLNMNEVTSYATDIIYKDLEKAMDNGMIRFDDMHQAVANMFHHTNTNVQTRFMDALDERNRESAERIKALMFTFDDLERVDSAGVQVILRQVDKAQLSVALKGSNDHIREVFFKEMSERAAKIMREDMAAMGAVRLKDVDEAQTAIAIAAKELADNNEIIIAGSGEEDELVY